MSSASGAKWSYFPPPRATKDSDSSRLCVREALEQYWPTTEKEVSHLVLGILLGGSLALGG